MEDEGGLPLGGVLLCSGRADPAFPSCASIVVATFARAGRGPRAGGAGAGADPGADHGLGGPGGHAGLGEPGAGAAQGLLFRGLPNEEKAASYPYMSTVAEIESAIEKLSPQERRELAAWYEERQALLNAADSVLQTYDDEEQAK